MGKQILNQHIVVFDGTSAYVISKDELQQEIENNDVQVLGIFGNLEDASALCDDENNNNI